MSRVFAPFIRSLAFVRKEVVEVGRQPRLVATLIVGPFLILLLFGLGYRSELPALRTLFVGDPESALAGEVTAGLDALGAGDLEFVGLIEDRETALARLGDDEVDLVVVLPQDPVGTIRGGERAVFEVAHRQLDPFEEATIALAARGTIDRVNRQLLEAVVTQAQQRSEGLATALDDAAEIAAALRVATESADTPETRRQLRALDQGLETVSAAGAAIADVGAALGDESLAAQVEEIRRRIDALPIDESSATAAAAEAGEIERTVQALALWVGELQQIDPAVLVSPFGVEAGVVGAVDLDLTDFYAPAVIALLLQHLAITFAALSLARERTFGTTELFAVAPLRVGEMLIGKYLGYAIIAGVVGGALSLAMLTVFDVPMVGSIASYAGVLALTMAASLGIGFVISTMATSDTQAVNAAMIMLLLSIFFSGFFIDLFRLAPAVQVVSRLLPITYAIEGLRSVMFTDAGVPDQVWLALGVGSIGLAVVAWALMARRLRTA